MRLRAVWCVSAIGPFILGAAVLAQAPIPSFDAASVKSNISGGPRSGIGVAPGGRITITNQTLRQIIRSAYGSQDIEVIGGPDWIDSDHWDILATAGTGDSDPPWRSMLKSLLSERFRLQAHTESQERPIFTLIAARSDKQLGPKIHPTGCKAGDICGSTQANTNGIVSGTITGTARNMADIAQTLSRYAERRVFDRTGLDGRYDFELQWSDTSVFTALQEQLGLKLEASKAPVDVVVVDRVDHPSEN